MRSFAWVGASIALGMSALLFNGCGSKGNGFDSGVADDGGNNQDDGGSLIGDDSGMQGASLIINPMNPSLVAMGAPVTQQFTAVTSDTMMPVNNATWSLDNVALGAVDGNGLFTAKGTVGGVANITAEANGSQGSTTVSVTVIINENPGGISMSDQMKLQQGGNADNTFRWLYPYDKTVFPRGLVPAIYQFDGNGATAFMVHMKAKNVDYTGFFKGSSPMQVQLSPTMWKNVLASVGASDPLSVEVTKLNNGQVSGPIKETWTIAQGSLRGSCYYNTYNNGGGTIRLKLGGQAQQIIGNCNVCHSVSANGNVLASNYGHQYGATWDLSKPMPPTISQGQSQDYSFPGVYPDGSIFITSYGQYIPGMWQTNPVKLMDGKTGNMINSPGIPTANNPQMPAFSPDGKWIAFNRGDTGSKTLSIMAFDYKSKTFSKLQDLFTDQQYYPSWPEFTPDARVILFHRDNNNDFATWSGNQANVWALDVQTKKVASCDLLNGMNGMNTYLPYGAQETNYNFEPTILPLAVGGYYWTIFTTRRLYGNITTPGASMDQRKKLWVSAIDINSVGGKDPSHPAFYLDGQDLQVGSLRGFWALDPCKMNGQTCESGDECCGGFCRQVGNTKVCVPPPMGCSMEFETCQTAADCCKMGSLCINNHCATPPPN